MHLNETEDSQNCSCCLTKKEREYVAGLRNRFVKMRKFLKTCKIERCNIDDLFANLTHFCTISGNLHNSKSFGACLLAKRYLLTRFKFEDLDIAAKAQGANGFDVDEKTKRQKRIIAQIKTTIPYCANKLGSNQLDAFKKDFRKLSAAKADKKYFFVTNKKTNEYIKKAFCGYTSITVVLLKYNVPSHPNTDRVSTK